MTGSGSGLVCRLPPGDAAHVYVGVQALRFVAAALVVTTHATFYISERLDPTFPVWHAGTHGVQVFFVISGFVMAARGALARQSGWLTFAKRRIVRIVPMYWLALSVKSMISLFGSSLILHAQFAPAAALMSLLFIPFRNTLGRVEPLLGVGWTLEFEMAFYALFTLGLFLRFDWLKLIGLILVALAIGSLLPPTGWVALDFYLNAVVLNFLMGMLIARWVAHRPAMRPALSGIAVATGFVLLLLPDGALPLPLAGTTCLGATLLVGGVVNAEPMLRRRCPAWLIHLGDASYALYLSHPLVAPAVPAALAVAHVGSAALAVGLCLAVSVVVSVIIYDVVERPVVRWASRFLGVAEGGKRGVSCLAPTFGPPFEVHALRSMRPAHHETKRQEQKAGNNSEP